MVATAELGRSAFAQQRWVEAYELLAGCDSAEPDDDERMAVAAHLLGRDADSVRAWERAHLGHVRRGDRDRAARCAFWLGLSMLLRGEVAQAGGWLGRAERLVEEAGHGCSTRGLLLMPAFLEAVEAGDGTTALALAREVVDVGQRFDDADVRAFGVLGCGQASLVLGETSRGMRLLDEVMVSVKTGEVSPIAAGIVYCAVIEACMDLFDLRRAVEWTDALHDWCAGQPDLVPFRGQCMVHRSQVLQAHGAWAEAMAEAERAHRHLSEPAHPALGLALYQQGELHRLRGELAEAERAYRAAAAHGRQPTPGMALLRLAEGNLDAAVASILRMLDESRGSLTRPTVLAAAVDVLLPAGRVEEARATSEELGRVAAMTAVPLLDATAAYAAGSVLLAEGDPAGALAPLRRACTVWRALGIPYDAARAQAQLGRACDALGDDDAACLELDAARDAFTRLGARVDLVALAPATTVPAARRPPGLTARECEVLRLVAAGRTNRAIAAELSISQHTVARHLQNIFTKLDVSSRAAATAYAYEHGVV